MKQSTSTCGVAAGSAAMLIPVFPDFVEGRESVLPLISVYIISKELFGELISQTTKTKTTVKHFVTRSRRYSSRSLSKWTTIP